MGVWTEKRKGVKAVIIMATPCPKSLHGNGEKLAQSHSHTHLLYHTRSLMMLMMFITVFVRD